MKPLYQSSTVQAAVSAFVILLINTAYATWDGDSQRFRPPSQVEVSSLLGGAFALRETIKGRQRATESIGKPGPENPIYPYYEDKPLTDEELLEMSALTQPNFDYIASLPSADTYDEVDLMDSVDNEEDDALDIDFTKLQGKYKLVAKQDTKLKTFFSQSAELAQTDWLDVPKGEVIEVDSWKFLKEQNSHIQVGIDEYKNINDGQFYVFAPHFDLVSVTGNKVEIETLTSPVQVISKNKTTIKLPGYQSTFYLEDSIYPGSAFTWGEATKNGSRVPPTRFVVDNIILQARNLDKLREFNGNKPLVVTSWFRDARTNAAVGGATRSDHLTGRSTDVVCPSMKILDFQNVCLSFWKFGGVGKGFKKGFVHVSSDASYRIWDY